MSQPIKKINDLKQLLLLVTQDEEGLNEHLYSKLRVGDMWWIPDAISRFGRGGRHPWVVVADYHPNHPPILACPRTTKMGRERDELFTPANILPGLQEEGVILLGFRRTFDPIKFREFEYIDRLPVEWIHKVRSGIISQAKGTP